MIKNNLTWARVYYMLILYYNYFTYLPINYGYINLFENLKHNMLKNKMPLI